jgi:hypothetical protein
MLANFDSYDDRLVDTEFPADEDEDKFVADDAVDDDDESSSLSSKFKPPPPTAFTVEPIEDDCVDASLLIACCIKCIVYFGLSSMMATQF